MPKRISRKLLVGLGSIVTFGAVGTISGFGIKSIIDSSLNNSKLNQLNFNTSDSGRVDQLPNYHVATEDMFIKTKNLKRFHFGNTQIGQKITPWGWLGVFDDVDEGVKSRIALTSWNGEIIWVNDDYKSLDQFNVYDMQYDFNSNLIFVLRSNSSNGFYNGNNDYPKVFLEILNAETGEKYKDKLDDDDFELLQQSAVEELTKHSVLLDGYDTKPEVKAKTKNLYYLDITYSPQKKAIMATWMPNYMQMARQSYTGNQDGSLPSFFDVIKTWDKVATGFMFGIDRLEKQQIYSKKQRKFNLLDSSGINPVNDTQGKLVNAKIEESQLVPSTEVNASDIFLLTNPFFTTSHDGNAFVMHLIGATLDGKVYHKTIGWTIDISDNAKTNPEIYQLTNGNVNLTDKRRYDNIEYWTNGGDFFSLKTDKSWSKAKGWNQAFINANLRVNKNMFDENSIVFAYPYSSSADETNDSITGSYGENNYAMPVFNVAQIWLDKNNAQFKKTEESSKKFHTNYDFGKQIDNYYIENKDQYSDSSRTNNIYPYPSPSSFDDNNVNHLYNRLISVSPFDNTIIYAAKPNVRESIFSPHTTTNKDKWAGFWLANSWAWEMNNSHKYYHPLVVAADQSIVSNVDDRYNADEMSYMLSNINDLYRDGFTFDISSRMDIRNGSLTSLNLYFNQTGRGVNETYNSVEGFQSSKIGLLRNVLLDAGSNQGGLGSKGWADNITPRFPGTWNNETKKLFGTTINKDSFSSIIHSRADLKKWYPRTWSNANFPSNMLKAYEIFWIDRQELWDVPVANQFGTRLTGTAFNGGNKSIDLVSAWKDKNEENSKYLNRLRRLIMIRPKIQAGKGSEEDGLGLVTSYELPPELLRLIINKEGWRIENNQSHLTLTKVETVPNTSKQILSSWSDSYKMKKIATKTGEIDQATTAWNEEIGVTNKLDKKDHINNPDQISFGNGNNNNITRNNTTALRLMLKIVKPSGNLPNWFNGLSDDFFNKAYPLEPAYAGETTFKEVVKVFADKKAELIDLSQDNSNLPVGLGNLKIDAYLQLNPKFARYDSNNDKIYKITSGRLSGANIIVDKDQTRNYQQIIYKDEFNGSRTIYDQSATSYADFVNGGFGSTTASWTQNNDLNNLKNIKVTTNYNQLPDSLVRKPNDTNPLLTFDFKDGTSDLELIPSDSTWFLNHFKNYNRLIGLFVQFEYQAGSNNEWTPLAHNGRVGKNIWTDQEISGNLAANQNKLLLNGVPKDIKKLRFRLVQNPDSNDPSSSIDITNFSENDPKYISNEFGISIQRITVDKEWISAVELTNNTNSLADLTDADVTKYETAVLAKIQNQNERAQVQLVYQFENNLNLTAAELVKKVKEKFNNFSDQNQGVFALWNGTNGSQLIKAKFVLKNNVNNEFKLVTANNPNPQDSDLTNDVKSNIKSKIDMSTYINQIKSTSIRANMGDQPGKIQPGSVEIPAKKGQAGSGRFHGKTFTEINSILSSVGISIKFKQWENGAWSSNWIELNAITSYAPNKPEIQMGFVFDNNAKPTNLELDESTTEITDGKFYTLKLNLPKIVKLPTSDQSIKDAYNTNPFGGNTKKLTIDEGKLQTSQQAVLSELKKASGNPTDYAGLDQVLEFKYKIGNSNFLTANELKKYLESQQDDQTSNALKLKIEIKAPTNGQDPEFALEEALKTKEFELLPNDNKIIKKWLHGKEFEKELQQNNITVTGSKTDLTYNLGGELADKFDKSGKYSDHQLILQYRLLDVNNQPINTTNDGWTDGYLPNSVQSNVNKIELRVGSDPAITEAEKIYVYGPEIEKTQAVATIDLSQIATLIKVDPNWFNEIAVVTSKTDSKSLTPQIIQAWEEKIYAKIPQLATDANLKNKLVIKYEFTRHTGLTSTNLARAIEIELGNYTDSTHHGIVKLYDKNETTPSGYQIKATFEKQDPNDTSIKFVDNTNASIDGDENKERRTGVVDTTNITTTLNLSDWIKNLIDNLTVVTTAQAGTIPQGGLKPPTLNAPVNSKLFAGQIFADIERWLKTAKVNFLWKKDETGSDWKTGTDAITQYDPTKKKLWFALDNQSTNLRLTLGNGFTDLDWTNRDNKNNPITIKLDAPATIDISPSELIKIKPFITGNTKTLKVDQAKINEELKKMKQSLGSGFEDAPLTIMIKVGNEAFYDYKNVATELSKLPDDVDNGIVVAKFEIDRSQANGSKFELTNSSKAEQQIINDDGTIKVYINDKGIYKDLEATVASGSSKALKLEWQKGISIDSTSGDLTANPLRGKGLRIEFTFNKNLTGADSDATGNANEIDSKWVTTQPTTFRPGVDDKLFIRIRLTDSTKYIYDQINQKITIDLTKIKSIIELNADWLNQQIAPTEIQVPSFGLTQIQSYETGVLNAMTTINDNLKEKIEIRYEFNDQNDIDKNRLNELIQSYKNNNSTKDNLGILQFWNQNSGEKIVAKFAVKEQYKTLYELEFTGDANTNRKELDTSKVITTIDFANVIQWLTQTNKLVNVKGDPQAATFTIPNVSSTSDDVFNGLEWTKTQQTLALFGITIQYREILTTNAPVENEWKNDLTEIKKYDQNIGKIGIRFKFDKKKSINIKLKTGTNPDQIYDGKIENSTPQFELSLNIKLTLKIDPNIVNTNFVNQQDVISGNTKFLTINKNHETKMIKAIKDQNAAINNEFNNANLIVKYKLDFQSDDKWNTLTEFTKDLETISTDQQSNKVLFKFEVTNIDAFTVDNSERTLFDPTQTNPEQWKVKLFINNSNWETNAAKVIVTGTTSGLKWNWNGLGVNETNNKVGNTKLHIEFTGKPNPNYDETDVEDDGDLKTKWSLTKPSKLDPTIQDLWIRIKANPGYVYGPAYDENNQTKTATVHKVNLQIKREILVNPKQLLTTFTFDNLNGRYAYVTDISEAVLEKFVQEGLDQIAEPTLRSHVTVKFNFNSKKGLTSEQLHQEIQSIINSNNDPDYGILQLWNGSAGQKIDAFYDLSDPNGEYILVTANNGDDPKEPQTIITDVIRTKIDLIEIVNDLKNQKIQIESITFKNNRNLVPIQNWIMPNIKSGTEALNGLTWDKFEQRLKALGVLIEARVVKNPDNNQDWKPLDQLKEYDDTTLQLALRFRIESDGFNIVVSTDNNTEVEYDPAGNSTTSEFKMNIKAPATVVVEDALIQTFISKDSFSGNTKNINIIPEPEKELIDGIVKKNLANNPDVFKDLQSRLEVQYYLGTSASTNDDDWRTAEKFKEFLAGQNTDQTTNKIWFRLNVKNLDDPNAQIFQIDQTARMLMDEDISAKAKIKIYINETGFTAKIDNLKAVGSTDNFSITGLSDWLQIIPKGLKVWYSNETNPNDNDDAGWNQTQPTTLNTDKKLWVRFKVEDGYVFQGARTDKPEYSEKKPINTDGIKVIIKLQKSWLEKIEITGDLKNPGINEEKVKQEITNTPGTLPANNPNLIKLEYRIKGTDQWFDKDSFIKKLAELKGAKDSKNFILKREELEVRFAINGNENEYGLNINGDNISPDNSDNYNVQIVDDANNRNTSFQGYINLDLLSEFKKENFKVQGSTSRPQLIIDNKGILDTMLLPYQSDNLFDVIYSTTYDENSKTWTWDNTKTILSGGKFIEPDDLWKKLQATIGPDKKFAIKFISKDSNKYKVYKTDVEQTDGYILDLSDNVKITIEITNPFTQANKTLGIWTRDDSKQGKYYQGEGGFRIVVADKNSLEVDSNATIQSAQQFLESSSLANNEKQALEFVFHNFGPSASQTEMDRVKQEITNYNSDTWKSFDDIKDTNRSNDQSWSRSIGLKVGDYVAVALRVKKDYATAQENAFILKDNDYSMILPVMSVNGTEKKPGRISGYKIKTSEINLNEESITLLNMVNPDLPPLDGWTLLSRLSLNPDEKGNYLGVDLDLQFYNEFYKNTSDEILISGSGAKLVKRVASGDGIYEDGEYKDGSGQTMKDENSQPIKIYKDKSTKRLSNPEKKSTPTKTKKLDNLGQGSFRLIVSSTDKKEQGLLSLFKNQDVDLKLVASKGESTDINLPDFYLDEQKNIELKNIINPQIKYPIENEKRISYGWNYDDFLAGNIEYKDPKNPNNKRPEEGFAQIATIFELIKKEQNQKDESITGSTISEAVQKISKQIKDDFKGQLKFQIERYDSKGSSTLYEGNNIYQFQDLKNKDRIVLKIVATEEDLYYVNTERPLIINVDGLTQASPDKSTLQHLRVKQGGVIDGQGSFKVLVSNPDNANEDDRQILKGWKFMIRVWGTDKKIKIQWTDDPGLVKGLTNGDKVEWKLVSEEGNPVTEPYYNTIALQHQQNPDGSIDYKFAKVNYKNGDGTYEVVNEGIGDYPDDETKYPEDSGFVISGLKSAVDIFQISKENFAKVMQQLNPTYVGINKQGTIKMEPKYFEDKYWVNSEGELFTKDQPATLKAQDQEQTKKEILLTEFLDNVTFYTHDPVLANYQGGFKFSGNDVNNNNHLTNGDKVWATFDMLNESDENIIVNGNEIVSSVTLQLADVSGLKEVIDPMSPLWYVLMALAGVVTLGTAALIAFLMTRHKKLKGK